MEVSEVRQRIQRAIEDARRRVAERRTRIDDASKAYEQFLSVVAVPAFHKLSQALVGEGHRFKVQTPGQAVRLVPDRPTEDYIELAFDGERDAPGVVARTSRGRGRRTINTERAVAEDKPIADLTEEDVVAIVVEELLPFVER
jgi:hypothetical protein